MCSLANSSSHLFTMDPFGGLDEGLGVSLDGTEEDLGFGSPPADADEEDSAPTTTCPKKNRQLNGGRTGPQQCGTCSKNFSNASALTKHKLTHSNERRHSCHLCGKAFKRQDHLNGHLLTHRNKKPFECNAKGCGKSYCDGRSLRRHMEGRHNGGSPHSEQPPTPPQIPPTKPGKKTMNASQSQLHRLLTQRANRTGAPDPVVVDGTTKRSKRPTPSPHLRDQISLIHQIIQQAQQQQQETPKPSKKKTKKKSPPDGAISHPVECTICYRRFKNTPALNGHMRLHGGYYRKAPHPHHPQNPLPLKPPLQLQTASSTIRARIEEKIHQKRATRETLAVGLEEQQGGYSAELNADLFEEVFEKVTSLCPLNFLSNLDDSLLSAATTPPPHSAAEWPSCWEQFVKLDPASIPPTISHYPTPPSSLESTALQSPLLNIFEGGVDFGGVFAAAVQEAAVPDVLTPSNSPKWIGPLPTQFFSNLRPSPQTPHFTPHPILNPVRPAPGLYWPLSPTLSHVMGGKDHPRINLGEEFQAGEVELVGGGAYDGGCREELMWDPKVGERGGEEMVSAYLEFSCSLAIPGGGRNQELALHLLHRCRGDIQAALLHLMSPTPTPYPHPYPSTSKWSPHEVTLFRSAIRRHGKDFGLISAAVGKSRADCLDFYHLWKKVRGREYEGVRGVWREQGGWSSQQREKIQGVAPPSGRESLEDWREYPCRMCGKTFPKIKSRSAHMKSHRSPPESSTEIQAQLQHPAAPSLGGEPFN